MHGDTWGIQLCIFLNAVLVHVIRADVAYKSEKQINKVEISRTIVGVHNHEYETSNKTFPRSLLGRFESPPFFQSNLNFLNFGNSVYITFFQNRQRNK